MTLPTLRIVVDDREPLTRFASEFADVQTFGALRRGRQTMLEHVAVLSTLAGLAPPLVLPATGADVERQLRRPGSADATLWLVLPASLGITAPDDDAVQFLRKLALLTQPTALWSGSQWAGALTVDTPGLQEYVADPEPDAAAWRAAAAAHAPAVSDGLHLADLHEPAAFLELLSSSFSARHFNEVAQDRHLIVKRSRDVEKMRREHDFFGLLPAHLQPYFVQPFGFQEEPGGAASYRMHRLLVPDLAVQWVHRAFAPDQFDRLLEQLMRFIDERSTRRVAAAHGTQVAAACFDEKVRERVDQFAASPLGDQVDHLLRCSGVDDGLAGLTMQYQRVRRALETRRTFDALSITHGDYCFSNILYNPATRSVHLIDPRGATAEDDLYSDPYYDIAKLSHSILGGYDLIVAERTVPTFDTTLGLALQSEREDDPRISERFSQALSERGFSLPLARAYEASLFLSMLPLHADAPRRVLAFALRSAQILTHLEHTELA